MRFKRKQYPTENQTRTYRKFLWLPLTVCDETRWLEFAWVREETRPVCDCVGVYGYEWRAVAWADEWERRTDNPVTRSADRLLPLAKRLHEIDRA